MEKRILGNDYWYLVLTAKDSGNVGRGRETVVSHTMSDLYFGAKSLSVLLFSWVPACLDSESAPITERWCHRGGVHVFWQLALVGKCVCYCAICCQLGRCGEKELQGKNSGDNLEANGVFVRIKAWEESTAHVSRSWAMIYGFCASLSCLSLSSLCFSLFQFWSNWL